MNKVQPFQNLRRLMVSTFNAVKKIGDLKKATMCIRKRLLTLDLKKIKILLETVMKLGWKASKKLSWAVRAIEGRMTALENVQVV